MAKMYYSRVTPFGFFADDNELGDEASFYAEEVDVARADKLTERVRAIRQLLADCDHIQKHGGDSQEQANEMAEVILNVKLP